MSESVIDIHPHLASKSSEANFVLRVLSGKQQGAEIELKAARYQIGASEDCDIVLMNASVAPKHLELFFADGQATLTQIHETVYINNQPITQQNMPLELGNKQIMMLGDVAVSIGDSRDDWPQLDAINQEVIETLALIKTNKPQTLWAVVQQQLQDKQNATKLAMLVSISVSVFIVMLAFALHTTSTPEGIAAAAADRLVQQLETDPAYKNIRVVPSKPKKQLIGYVQRTAELNRLRNLAHASLLDINIVSVEKIEKSLNIISQVYGGNLSYKLIPGKDRNVHLLLYGTIEATQQREAIFAILRRDLPSITSVKIDIITQSEALEIIHSWLSNYPNFANLKVRKTKEGIFVSGNLLGNFRKSWQEALIKSPPRLPQNMLPFIDIFFSPAFEGKIVSFITGNKAQLRIFYKDKSVLAAIGDKVRGGFLIHKIMRDKIILSWRNQNFIYPLPN